MSESEDDAQVSIPLDYSEVEDFPVSWGNYFLLQYANGEWVLTVAQVRPPTFLTEDQQRKLINAGGVLVHPVARVVVSREKLESLKNLIERQLEKFPGVVQAAADHDTEEQ